MPLENIVGWDLGGAHIKAAWISREGFLKKVIQHPCPLWQGLDQLLPVLDGIMEEIVEPPDFHAITMTGELVDAFVNREEGVRALVNTMEMWIDSAPVYIYAGRTGFLAPAKAVHEVTEVASANWLASVYLAASKIPEGLFVDTGSTTTDVIPFAKYHVLARGFTDHERLRYEELIYTGVVRTPVMALAKRVPFKGVWVQLMSEIFATTADVYRLLHVLPVHADRMPSADNRGKSEDDSARRLARMVGCDLASAELLDWRGLASYLAECQLRQIQQSCAVNLSRGIIAEEAPLVGAGVGRFLVRELASRFRKPYIDFNDFFPDSDREPNEIGAADCAPAVAVAFLARDAFKQSVK